MNVDFSDELESVVIESKNKMNQHDNRKIIIQQPIWQEVESDIAKSVKVVSTCFKMDAILKFSSLHVKIPAIVAEDRPMHYAARIFSGKDDKWPFFWNLPESEISNS